MSALQRVEESRSFPAVDGDVGADDIFAMAPSSVERCGGKTRIMLTGRNLLTKQQWDSETLPPQVFLNGQEGTVDIENATLEGGKRQVISITFDPPGSCRRATQNS